MIPSFDDSLFCTFDRWTETIQVFLLRTCGATTMLFFGYNEPRRRPARCRRICFLAYGFVFVFLLHPLQVCMDLFDRCRFLFTTCTPFLEEPEIIFTFPHRFRFILNHGVRLPHRQKSYARLLRLGCVHYGCLCVLFYPSYSAVASSSSSSCGRTFLHSGASHIVRRSIEKWNCCVMSLQFPRCW